MSEQIELLRFLNEVENDVTAEVQPSAGNEAEFREVAFTRLLSDELEANGFLESPVVCHYEYGKAASALKVSGYAVPDEDSRLDLFVTVYRAGFHSELPTMNAADVESAFKKLERFLGRALNGLHEELEPALPERYMAERIHQLQGTFDRVNFYLLTNSRLSVRGEKKRKTESNGLTASYEVWDIERFRRLRDTGPGEPLNVDLRSQPNGGISCVRLDVGDDGYRTCVAIFPGLLLRDLYDEHGSRLLELNVRSYLQAKGKINKGILETLRTAPADFMAYNNGITVVAEGIVFGGLRNGQEGIVELRGMQIVNGGQTTASIHRASKEYEADLSKVYVQGKIVTVDSSRFNEVVPLISKYANSQNKVTEPDLQANHRFHVEFERTAKREWTPDQTSMWFYERARGGYQTARSREGFTDARRREFDKKYPAQQRFTKEDLAKFENCWRGLPHIVNKGGQKNFTHFMTTVKQEFGELPDNWELTPGDFKRYIGKAILFRDVQHIVKGNKQITAYRVNVTAYTVALLAEKTARRIDLDAVWKRQHITEALGELAAQWSAVVFKELLEFAQKQTVHIDNVLKSQATWEHMLGLSLRVPTAVENELLSAANGQNAGVGDGTGQRIAEGLTPQDHNNAARCMELSATQWMAIVAWAQSTGEFQPWQLGVAATLASYAAQGWTKPPSVRQAKHGFALIQAAGSAGVFATH